MYLCISLLLANIANHGLYDGISIVCSKGNCQNHTTIIAGSIIGGGTGIILLFIVTLLCCHHSKGRPLQTNLKFVNSTNHKIYKHELYDVTIFTSGIWSSRHYQSGMWHSFSYFMLSFDPKLFKVTGSGLDNIGIFTIDGTYSIETGRMGLIKTYQLGTKKRTEDFKYQMIIQLTWNSETHQFEGKWYVQTNKYRGTDKFQLKFTKQQQQSSPNNKENSMY
ncbi:unnamed protein product [Adineta steineri]|uniref:Uncharacterized protein n=1 Tax=Adineta steineri TaxID=433720 RepID=A0A814XA80_9BILA|nr:unnamed protein product [Adineta steineri]